MWVFGYGSLVWRPAFPHLRSAPARIKGWSRRFWQGSTDHRGIPEAPGRVVTLLRVPETECWGRVYEIAPADEDAVLAQLDHREQGGYDRFTVTAEVQDLDVTTVESLVYVATEDNPNYLGPAPLAEMAAQIRQAHGPSGPNTEYLLRLDEALTDLGGRDPHVAELAAEVRRQLDAPA